MDFEISPYQASHNSAVIVAFSGERALGWVNLGPRNQGALGELFVFDLVTPYRRQRAARAILDVHWDSLGTSDSTGSELSEQQRQRVSSALSDGLLRSVAAELSLGKGNATILGAELDQLTRTTLAQSHTAGIAGS